MLRPALVVAVSLALGCGPQNRAARCSPSASGVNPPPILLSLVGERVEVDLLLPPAVFCPDGNPVATGVVTEVLDAMNQPVAHEHSAPTSSDTAGYATRVTFTPTTAGVHYLTARFEPALGLSQRQTQAVLERSGEPVWRRARLGPVCDEVLPLGEAVLCRRGNQLTEVRDGGVVGSQTIAGVATAGDGTAWWWTAAVLSRAVEVDGGFARLELPLPVSSGAIAVTADRWLQGTGADFLEVQLLDGGLVERRWSVDATASPIMGKGLSRAGEVVGWATPTRVCAGAPDASVACLDSPLQPLASEGDALWLRGAESGVVALARVSPDGGAPLVLFVPAQSAALLDSRQSRPAFAWNGLLVAVRASDLTLEAWRAPGPVARQTVSERHVVFQLQTGEAVIYRR